MFQSDADVTRRSPIVGVLKAAVPALAAALSLATATASHATEYIVNSLSMDHQGNYVLIYQPDGTFNNQGAYIAPVLLKVDLASNPAAADFSLLAFCVDIYHEIDIGNLGYQYNDDGSLENNSAPLGSQYFHDLTAPQINQVGLLVNFGTKLYRDISASDRIVRLAGLQGAIWQVVNTYPNGTHWSFDSPNDAIDSYTAKYADAANNGSTLVDYGPLSSRISVIRQSAPHPGEHQSFAFAVPEPATWALMISGFGLCGAMLRRERRQAVRVRA